jgi:CRISPR-associated protein Cas6
MNEDPDPPLARMVDVSFALDFDDGASLPLAHRDLLASEVEAALPWLGDARAGEPDAGVHRLNLAAESKQQVLLSRRTRLVLRVPRERAACARALAGATLRPGPARLRVGEARVRELVPWGTLYAHCVSVPEGRSEVDFLHDVQEALHALQAPGRAICGRAQALEGGRLCGFSLMVDGLSATQALRLMERGMGPHRRLGCGLFVPHKSAAAVGAPP